MISIIMTLSSMTLSVMTLMMRTPNIMTVNLNLSMMIVSIINSGRVMTLNIKGLFVTVSIMT
jgi:hypothetical protein